MSTPTPAPPKPSTPPATAPAKENLSPAESCSTSAAHTTYPATPASSHDKEAPSAPENPPNPRPEVQYETHALSRASPTVPIDGAIPASTSAVVNAIDVYWDPASE